MNCVVPAETGDHGGCVDRRKVLQGIAASSVGLVGASGVVGAQGQHGSKGKGKPCHQSFECTGGTYVKFEFVETDDGCEFVEETDTGLIEITNWTSKEGQSCEPISVEWEFTSEPVDPTSSFVVTKGLAYGGGDCDRVSIPADGLYTSDLENKAGHTAAISNLQFCVSKSKILTDRTLAYEDLKGGDFDYNDFGMEVYIEEAYPAGTLSVIEMEFTPEFSVAGHNHDIHLRREFEDENITFDYTVTREAGAEGNEKPAGTYTDQNGPLDIVLFDTESVSEDDTVTVVAEIRDGEETPSTTSPRTDIGAKNPLFGVYDPYMDDRSIDRERHFDEFQSANGELDGSYEVPYIVSVPEPENAEFDPPEEREVITNEYSKFDDYYETRDPDDYWYPAYDP